MSGYIATKGGLVYQVVTGSRFFHLREHEQIRGGLGRIMFVAGALEYEKPFMGPLYRFLSLHPRGSIRRVPAYVTFILRYLARQVSHTRYFPTSRWFSHAITKEEFPWVFERGGKPSLLISSLEALAIIIALKVFFPAKGTDSKKSINLVPTWTDNRGNGSALNKLMSTRYPASALLMELASHMKHEKIKASVSWAPREVNKEADRLANGDTTGFDPNLRIHIVSATLTWYVLEEARHGQGGGTDV